MYKIYKLLNIDATRPTVSGIATDLESAIDVAGGASSNVPDTVNAFDLTVESGSMRVLYDGNTPTPAKGIVFGAGDYIQMRGVAPSEFSMVAVSGTCVLGVQLGHVPLTGNGIPQEPSQVFKAASVGEVSVSIDEFPDASAPTDTDANPDTTSIKSYLMGWGGTTWARLKQGYSAVLTSIAGFLNIVGYGQYNSTPLALTNLQWAPTQVAPNGAELSWESAQHDVTNDKFMARCGPTSVARTAGLASTLLAYNGAVGFKGLIGHNGNTTTVRYVMVFDRNSAPSVGATDWKFIGRLGANSDGGINVGELDYEEFANGIYIVTSSSDLSYQTSGISSEFSYQVAYETLT